jgi:hypothetical protein
VETSLLLPSHLRGATPHQQPCYPVGGKASGHLVQPIHNTPLSRGRWQVLTGWSTLSWISPSPHLLLHRSRWQVIWGGGGDPQTAPHTRCQLLALQSSPLLSKHCPRRGAHPYTATANTCYYNQRGLLVLASGLEPVSPYATPQNSRRLLYCAACSRLPTHLPHLLQLLDTVEVMAVVMTWSSPTQWVPTRGYQLPQHVPRTPLAESIATATDSTIPATIALTPKVSLVPSTPPKKCMRKAVKQQCEAELLRAIERRNTFISLLFLARLFHLLWLLRQRC